MIGAIANFVAFQLNWFANVLGGAKGVPWAGLIVLALWLALHFVLVGARARPDALLIVAAGVLGWVTDCAQVLLGFIAFPEQAMFAAPIADTMPPIWMAALWMGFAATLRHSLGWLRGRYLLGAALGAVGGPLAFAGGAALGAILTPHPYSLVAVGVQFALLTPVMLAICNVVDPVTSEGARASK